MDIFEEIRVYAAYSKNDEVRNSSSSGGIFSVLAEKILNQGGVVFGAAFNKKYEVEHIEIDSLENLYKIRGSKYVQSNLGDSFSKAKLYLEEGKRVLFAGTACQIRGLKSYLGKDYTNLFSADIVCHGTPSPMIWKKYLSENFGQVSYVDFRDKKNGWKDYSVTINDEEKNYSECFKDNYYMKAFLANFSLRPSCYSCTSKGSNVVSDITLGDYWGIEEIDPAINDNRGISLLKINSERGKELVEQLADKMFMKQMDVNKAIKYNPCLIEPVAKPIVRDKFFDEIRDGKTIKQSFIICKEGNIIKRVLRKVKNTMKEMIYG